MSTASGVTLIELVVVLLLMGLLASLTTVAVRSSAPPVRDPATSLEKCRRTAIAGRAALASRIDTVAVLCLPDGQVVGARAGQFVGRLP